MLRQLARHNVSIVFSGNSIMRHVFRIASYLKGVAHDDFSQDERALEKELCTKELDADAGGGAGKFRKAFCKSGCCGVCSCAYEVGKESNSKAGVVPLYFIWQQEWYDSRMRKVWDALLQSPPFELPKDLPHHECGPRPRAQPELNLHTSLSVPIAPRLFDQRSAGANTTTYRRRRRCNRNRRCNIANASAAATNDARDLHGLAADAA